VAYPVARVGPEPPKANLGSGRPKFDWLPQRPDLVLETVKKRLRYLMVGSWICKDRRLVTSEFRDGFSDCRRQVVTFGVWRHNRHRLTQGRSIEFWLSDMLVSCKPN